MCAAMFLALNGFNAYSAAKGKGKKTESKSKEDMQSHEMTMTGVISEEKEKESKKENKKPIKYRLFTDGNNKEWMLPREKKTSDSIDLKQYEGVKVKLVCMVLGEKKIIGIKSIEKIDK
jgi:hypothetical protein